MSAIAVSQPVSAASRDGAQTSPMFEAQDISISFGGIRAVDGVSFDVKEGEIFAIVGPNGAGKSTIFNLISRIYEPTGGRLMFRGTDITNVPPHTIAGRGIARTFQNIELFEHATVLDNLLIGRHCRSGPNIFAELLFTSSVRQEELRHRTAVEEIIDFLEIQHIRKVPVGQLPYGLQKRVELGRALAMEPDLLLLDEPMAGMNLEEKEDMSRFILDVNEHYGTTIALIEHDMGVVMDLSDRVVVLDHGVKIADAMPDEVKRDQAVIDAYLGLGH